MSDDNPKATPTLGLEQRWTEIRQAAEAIGSDVRLTIVVGGIDMSDKFRITDERDEPTTLGDSLDRLEERIADPRILALTQATKRMRLAEGIQQTATQLTLRRQREYAALIDAYHLQVETDLNEEMEPVGQILVSLAANDDGQELIDELLRDQASARAIDSLVNVLDNAAGAAYDAANTPPPEGTSAD